MSHISAEHLSQTYIQESPAKDIEHFPVLKDISFEAEEGEFIAIFGPNGSGKSTLFKIISGLESPSLGHVLIGGKRPQDVRIGFVFQDYRSSMLPWRNVLDNVALSLEARGVDKKERFGNAMDYLRQVKMEEYAQKSFWQLSGGQSQAVSIARALAFEPQVLMCDEPFSALDFETTIRMMTMLLDVWSKNRLTTLFISHRIEEAVYLADKVIVLSRRPGIIKEIIPVTLPRPRTISMLESPEFFKIQNKVLEVFKTEIVY